MKDRLKDGIKVLLLRHGKTEGNEQRRYVGPTDESLSESGRRELVAKNRGEFGFRIGPELVFVSPMKRCAETAELLFPKTARCVEDRLSECDFGVFEYKNYEELNGREDYQAWLLSGGGMDFPGGERLSDFKRRSLAGFLACMETAEKRGLSEVAFVVHGGTIMAVMEELAFPKRDYYSWQVKNGEGYFCRARENRLEVIGAYV